MRQTQAGETTGDRARRPTRAGERRAAGLWRAAAGGLVAGAILVGAGGESRAAGGAGVFWTRATLLRSFFATSERVTWRRLSVGPPERVMLKRQLGRTPPKTLTVYYGVKGGRVQGVAVIDDERGQHKPITFGVLVGPDGRLRRAEVMVYREPRGGEIRSARFCGQFRGKTAADRLRIGREIDAISGATISARAVAVGVRRDLLLLDALLFRPGLERVLLGGGRGR